MPKNNEELFSIDVDGKIYNCIHEYLGDNNRDTQNKRNGGEFDDTLRDHIRRWPDSNMAPYNNFECCIRYKLLDHNPNK